jgi:phosphatidate cytidylyltransferase
MFKTRVISGAVCITLIAAMNFTGGPFMAVILYLLSVQGLFEFYRATGVYDESGSGKHSLIENIGYAGAAVYYAAAMLFRNNSVVTLMLILCVVLVAMLAAYVFTFPRYSGDLIMKAFFGFMYVPVMMCFIFLTRSMPGGAYLVWLIYISSWISDTCAYLVGSKFGNTRLAPELSPAKSVEGAVGGIAGSALVAVIFSIFFMSRYGIGNILGPLYFMLIGIVGSIASQVGDLAASAFKRNHGVKDYGVIIPGHGGILDRFDSVIFTAPMIYFLADLIIRL